uniref:Uncharacterized protein n=1 Tax=Octopus bimaculoides TaxID=37653 RepID=A0A0L8G6Q8_OCTBM
MTGFSLQSFGKHCKNCKKKHGQKFKDQYIINENASNREHKISILKVCRKKMGVNLNYISANNDNIKEVKK